MIRFDRVSKRYRDVEALREVSFEVNPGEVFGYIGPNGAGKTTSIKILTGLIRDFHGAVYVDGKNAAKNRDEAQRLIGYLPQDAGFQEWRTVDHALQTFAKLSGVPDADREAMVSRAVQRTGLDGYRDKRIVHLSGGTVQRLRLAQAILHNPRILIMDEPLSGLDPASRYQVKEIIRELATEDRVVFFSSHILSDVENVATRIGILHDGSIRRIGTPRELREEFRLGTIIEIELRDNADIDSSVFAMPAVESVEVRDGGALRLHLDPNRDLDESISSVLATAAARRVPVRSLRHLQPSLEDVYLNLTRSER